MRGFTLIELLVVVAIIAVLVAILLPSLASAKANANRAKCGAVLRQWGEVVHLYANEYDNWVQSSTNWAVAIGGNGPYDTEWPPNSKFSRGLHTCPGDPSYGAYLDNGASQATANMGPIQYCFIRFVDANSNRIAAGKMNGTSWRMTDINHPSTALLMCDSATAAGTGANGSPIVSYRGDLDSNTTNNPIQTLDQALTVRHRGLGNVLFVDGHVEQHKTPDFAANIVASAGGPPNGKYWTLFAIP